MTNTAMILHVPIVLGFTVEMFERFINVFLARRTTYIFVFIKLGDKQVN